MVLIDPAGIPAADSFSSQSALVPAASAFSMSAVSSALRADRSGAVA
jgi:hypothetical protein